MDRGFKNNIMFFFFFHIFFFFLFFPMTIISVWHHLFAQAQHFSATIKPVIIVLSSWIFCSIEVILMLQNHWRIKETKWKEEEKCSNTSSSWISMLWISWNRQTGFDLLSFMLMLSVYIFFFRHITHKNKI